MSLERMKFLAGLTESYNRKLDENDNGYEILDHLDGLLEQIPEMGFDDDVEEGIMAAIYAAKGEISELIEDSPAFTGRDSMSYMNEKPQ